MTTIYGDGGYGDGGYGSDPQPIIFDELTEYYIALLIIQYQNKTRARSTVGVFIREVLASDIYNVVRDGFDLETAVGVQLDILASYRGASRTVFGIDLSRDYFAMPIYDDPDPEDAVGMTDYGSDPAGYWILYADAERPLYSMTDDELRRFTMFLAQTHSSALSVKNIDDILWTFFGDKVSLIDNEDMTVEYLHDLGDTDTLFTIVSQTGSLPKPAGVAVSIV